MAIRHEPLQTSDISMVLVMGVTGSGKSHFINTLVGNVTKEYAGLRSGTKICQMVQTKIGADTSVAIVDTPGFDDTTRSDAEVFSLITKFLMSQFQLGIPLKGIIYLHRITDPKMQGSALRNFQMFQKICGDDALKNVVLLTTMWDRLTVEMEGLDRDQELREDFWSLMEEKGSYIARFDNSWQMAESLIARLIAKDSIILNIQKELQDEGKRLDQTSAGRLLAPDVDARIGSSKQHIDYLDAQIRRSNNDGREQERLARQKQQYQQQQRLEEQQREKLRAKVAQETKGKIQEGKKGFSVKEGLSTFVTITGVACSVIFNLLPLFGVNM